MTLEAGKTYKTRDGDQVRIYATDGGGQQPIHGAIKSDSEWMQVSWCANGSFMYDDEKSGHDLVPPIAPKPEPRRVKLFNYVFNEYIECVVDPDGALRVV